ncbi:MAG: urea ABC transporter substrate-binding protein [Candidatus Xenobia bacterium]
MPRLMAVVVVLALLAGCARHDQAIRLGVLLSQTGTMAISEKPIGDAIQLAVDDLNARGGVLGRRVETVTFDGASAARTFQRGAGELLSQPDVDAIFGCYTSASRKSVIPIVEQHQSILFYPVQYEGLEESPNVVYLGAAPNQQIIPAVKWCFDHLGKRMYLVGSDYVFPRTANAIIHEQLNAIGGTVVGEDYVLLGSSRLEAVVQRIAQAHPDVILNTLNGDSNVAFFAALQKAGITPGKVPVMSFSIGENMLQHLGVQAEVGDYAAWSYFQSIDTPANQQFVQRFRARYGNDRVVDDPMVEAYAGVQLWAQAVEEAETPAPTEVLKTISDQSCSSPLGVIYVDAITHHTWKLVRIGRINAQGQFDLCWRTEGTVRPDPFPRFRSREAWEQFLSALKAGWGGAWENPARDAAP